MVVSIVGEVREMTFAQSILANHHKGESLVSILVVGEHVDAAGEVHPIAIVQVGDNTAYRAILKGGQVVRTDE